MQETINDDDDIKDNEKYDQSLARQNDSINLLHKLSPTKDGREVPRDEYCSISRANLRIFALVYYLQCKGLIDATEFETYTAEYMEWYIDHIANKTNEEYGNYYIDIDNLY